jgi:hypothetical protein
VPVDHGMVPEEDDLGHGLAVSDVRCHGSLSRYSRFMTILGEEYSVTICTP